VSGHSQGSVIAAALILQLDRQARQKVRLLTYGNPLCRLYQRFFPAYFGPPAVARIREDLAADSSKGGSGCLWINLYRGSDPIGGPVVCRCALTELIKPDAVTASGGIDRFLWDPRRVNVTLKGTVEDTVEDTDDEEAAVIYGHDNYFADPAYGQALAALARAPLPAPLPAGSTSLWRDQRDGLAARNHACVQGWKSLVTKLGVFRSRFGRVHVFDRGRSGAQNQGDSDLRGTALKLAYERACTSYEGITEFRAKLLALLPLATGTGAFLLLERQGTNPAVRQLLGPIGLLGAIVTVGLFAYELRGMQRCHRLEVQACILEERLGLSVDEGPFKGQPDRSLGGMLGPPLAGLVIYLATAFTWLYIAGRGFCWWGNSFSAWWLLLLYVFMLAVAWCVVRGWLGKAARGEQTKLNCVPAPSGGERSADTITPHRSSSGHVAQYSSGTP
jgi:hypothetical protein